MEGVSQEAITLAGHMKLNNLIVLFDDNGISIDGPTSLSVSDDQQARFAASGWDTQAVDGHNPAAIAAAIAHAKTTDTPSMIACKTTIGFGAPTKAGKSSSHGAPLGGDEITGTRAALGWDHAAFEIPDDVLSAWRTAGQRGGSEQASWAGRLLSQEANVRADFERRMAGILPAGWEKSLDSHIDSLIETKPKVATRAASGHVLDQLTVAVPELIGGSADLTGSNNTKAKAAEPIAAPDYDGGYIYYGVREHGMAAAMNGMALHGGVIPFGGTFLVFTDYCRGSIRLSALMGTRVVYVMTHDSIGLGEAGPTHQPVEHLAALRAIPGLQVFRPADVTETAECWQLALESRDKPSVLALTRQDLEPIRTEFDEENLCARGAYEVAGSGESDAVVSIFASGSEVEIAMEAKAALDAAGHATRVVSVPSFELFAAQSGGYHSSIIGNAKVNVGIEAAIRMGWDAIIGSDAIFIGMDSFGASGPYKALYEHFGITSDAVVEKVKARISALS